MRKRTKARIHNHKNDNHNQNGIRLNKYLSESGACSRREADKYIEAGRVTVDSVKAVMGTKVQKGQVVRLDKKIIVIEEKLVFIAFNKPVGIECTTDKRVPENIIDYIGYNKRIFPIGRLDKDSRGLILLTNDGDLVNKILRADNGHEKEYIVTVNKPITESFMKGMCEGVPILDIVTQKCIIKKENKHTFRIILKQGMNRQIRRMCEHFGYKVVDLERIRIMNIQLGRLKEGQWRNITDKEIDEIREKLQKSHN